jgi:small basic protein (TIGR04137 family)
MSIHRSLKTKSGSLNQHRNVLTRAERITKLAADERFDPSNDSPLGLVKVRSIKPTVSKKKKTAGDEEKEAPKGGKK